MKHSLPLVSSIDNCSPWLTMFCKCEHHSVDQKRDEIKCSVDWLILTVDFIDT